jgi:hypothetical protein
MDRARLRARASGRSTSLAHRVVVRAIASDRDDVDARRRRAVSRCASRIDRRRAAIKIHDDDDDDDDDDDANAEPRRRRARRALLSEARVSTTIVARVDDAVARGGRRRGGSTKDDEAAKRRVSTTTTTTTTKTKTKTKTRTKSDGTNSNDARRASSTASSLQEERDALKSAYELVNRERDEAYAIRERARNAESDANRRCEAMRIKLERCERDLKRVLHVCEQVYRGELRARDLREFARCERSTTASPLAVDDDAPHSRAPSDVDDDDPAGCDVRDATERARDAMRA